MSAECATTAPARLRRYHGGMPEEATGKTGSPSEKRQKPERPRDALGRPLDWGAENQLELEDYDSFSMERNHELGRGVHSGRAVVPRARSLGDGLEAGSRHR